MHHKYVVRDGEAVWTGSTNWTADSWTREENVDPHRRVAPSSRPASRRTSSSSGRGATSSRAARSTPRRSRSTGRASGAWFCPGRGEQLAHRIAKAIGTATAPRSDRLAGHQLGADPRHARAGRLGRQGRPRRRRRPHADPRGAPPVAAERKRALEGAASPDGAHPRALLGQAFDARTPRARCTTTCTRRSPSPTTSSSSGASTSRTPASRTPRTCSRSPMPALADRARGLHRRDPRPVSRNRPLGSPTAGARRARARDRW